MPWAGVLEARAAMRAMQNCLSPDFSYHGVSLEAVGMKTALIQEVRTLRRAQGLVRVRGHGNAQRSRLAVLLRAWLPARQLGVQGGRRARHPPGQNGCLYLGKCWASLSGGGSAGCGGSER